MTPETRMGGNQVDVSLGPWPYRTRPLKAGRLENIQATGTHCRRQHASNICCRRAVSPETIHHVASCPPNLLDIMITGTCHGPRDHNQDPAAVPGTQPAVAGPGCAWKNVVRMLCGIVPESPTGTTRSFPRTFWIGGGHKGPASSSQNLKNSANQLISPNLTHIKACK